MIENPGAYLGKVASVSIFAPVFAPLLAAALGSGAIVPGINGAVPGGISDEDQPIVQRAQSALESLEAGILDPALLTPAFREQFTAGVIASDASFLKGRGAPTRWYGLQRDDAGTRIRYTFVVVFKDQNSLAYTFGINKSSNLIDALYFRPYNTP